MTKIDMHFDELAQRWPSTIVARNEVGKFTGGAINPGTMANYDCVGTGPEGRFKLNGRVVYPVRAFIEWLKKRVRVDQDHAPRGGRMISQPA
jgi:hypothetical protein